MTFEPAVEIRKRKPMRPNPTTRTIDLADATQSLADYAEQVDGGSIVVTRNGQPIAAVVALPNTDAETIVLSQNPQYLAIMERSRIRYAQEGGISSADMRKPLGLAPKQDDSAAAG